MPHCLAHHALQLFLALSVPLDSLHHDVSLAYNFEANYALPTNATELTDLEGQYGFKRSHSRTLRDLGRGDVYSMIQASISRWVTSTPPPLLPIPNTNSNLNACCRAGLPGRTCLLRAVCEASEWPMAEGLLGNILTVLLT